MMGKEQQEEKASKVVHQASRREESRPPKVPYESRRMHAFPIRYTASGKVAAR